MTDSKEIKPVIIDPKAPISLGITKIALGKLKKKFSAVPDATTKEGYNAIKEAKSELTPLRTSVEKERKLQVAAAVEHQRKVNAVAKTITETIQAIEAPLYAAKKAVDEAEVRRKQEEIEKEEKRISEIEGKVEILQSMAEGLLGASLEVLEARLKMANDIEITEEGYMEFVDPATIVLGQVKQQLEAAISNATVMAEQQEQLKAQQDAMVAQQKVLDDQQAEIDRQNKEREEREKQEEIERLRIAREEREKDEEAKRKKEQEKLDKKHVKELKARMPEDIKMRAFADALVNVEPPEDVKDLAMCSLMRESLIALKDIHTAIYSATQEQPETKLESVK